MDHHLDLLNPASIVGSLKSADVDQVRDEDSNEDDVMEPQGEQKQTNEEDQATTLTATSDQNCREQHDQEEPSHEERQTAPASPDQAKK